MPGDDRRIERVAHGPLGDLIGQTPHGASLLFVHQPGIDAEPFLYEIAHEHLSQGRKVVAVLLNRSPSTVTSEMTGLGYPPGNQPGELLFVDAFSPMLGVQEDTAYRVEDLEDPEALVQVLERVADEHPDAVLLLDSISAWIDRVGSQRAGRSLPDLTDVLDRFALSASLYTDWPYETKLEALTESFDALVRIGGLQDRVIFGQYFQVERVDWSHKPPPSRRHIFETNRPGGISVYIPKIVVTGPYNSGKSTFVASVSDEAVSVDRLGTTVALDHGHVEMEGISADVFGTPGQVRFDPILETVAGQALGVIVLVDATKPNTFDRARELLEKVWAKGLPGVIGANKQDLPNAMSAEEIQRELDPERRATVVECVGQEPDSARQVLERVTEQILTQKVEA